MFLLQVICCVIFIYGLLSMMQDIVNEVTYKRVFHHMKVVVFAKDLEKYLEQFVIELGNMKKASPYKQLIVVDLNEEDNIEMIKNRLYSDEIYVEVFNYQEGKQYLESWETSEKDN